MADFTQTISESLRIFEMGPVSRWGAFEWASAPASFDIGTNTNWGANRTIFSVEKVQTQTLTWSGSSLWFDVERLWEASMSASPDYFYDLDKLWTQTMAPTFNVTEVYRYDANSIFNYIFTGNLLDGEEQVVSYYSSTADPSSSYSSTVNTTTSWGIV